MVKTRYKGGENSLLYIISSYCSGTISFRFAKSYLLLAVHADGVGINPQQSAGMFSPA